MKNREERAKYDNYEMLDDYDFSDGVRGRFYKPKKVPTSMRLDNDILIFLKKQLRGEDRQDDQRRVGAFLNNFTLTKKHNVSFEKV